jgi:hypothetical protein
MKYLIFFILFSCGTNKSFTDVDDYENSITIDELKVVNDFLNFELKSSKYDQYNSMDILVLEDANNDLQSLKAYEFAFKEYHSYNKYTKEDAKRLGWFLNLSQVEKIKARLTLQKDYKWTINDFKEIKYKIIKKDSLIKSINKAEFIGKPEKVILTLSKPIIFDSNKALMSFAIGTSFSGYKEITHTTSLLKKVNGNWIVINEYWDGAMN